MEVLPGLIPPSEHPQFPDELVKRIEHQEMRTLIKKMTAKNEIKRISLVA